MIITSEDKVDDRTRLMFNKYILGEYGIALPGFEKLSAVDDTSSFNDLFLNDLISELPMDEFWILLIDVN